MLGESLKKDKIVVLGSCSTDFTTYAPRLPKPGETLHGHKFTTSFGGKGANQCVAAAKLGSKTFMIGRLGDDLWGKQYKIHLEQEGVDTSFVFNSPDVTTGIAQIAVADNGENQIVIVPGANALLSKSDIEHASDLIEKAEVLISQLETPFETTLEAFKLCKGLKILNAAPATKEIEEILPICSILCVNESEASLLTDIPVDLLNADVALKKLLKTGCKTVIITLGDKGAVYQCNHENQAYHVLCKSVTPVDTTGAGDAFVGALATFLVAYKDYPLHQIIGAACDVATISVTKEGSQASYPSDRYLISEEFKYTKLK